MSTCRCVRCELRDTEVGTREAETGVPGSPEGTLHRGVTQTRGE